MRRTIEISMRQCLASGRSYARLWAKAGEPGGMIGNKLADRTLSKIAIDSLPYRQATNGGVNIL
jgi:hypothetical protein